MDGIVVRNKKQWPRGCCFYFWLLLTLFLLGSFVARLCIVMVKKLMERCWRRSREENMGVSRDGGDEASNYPRRADTPVETFTLLTGSERKKSGIAPAFMPPTLLYSYKLTLQSSLDAIQSRAGLPSGSI